MSLLQILDNSVKQAWDYIALVQASTTDAYTFRIGGASGKIIATITVTYTDSTKATISTVVRS